MQGSLSVKLGSSSDGATPATESNQLPNGGRAVHAQTGERLISWLRPHTVSTAARRWAGLTGLAKDERPCLLKKRRSQSHGGLLGCLRVFLNTGDKIPKTLPGYFSIKIMKGSPEIATLLAKTTRATLTSTNYAFLKVAHRHTAVIKRENEIFICSRAILCQQRIRNASQQERPELAATSGQNVRPSKRPFP